MTTIVQNEFTIYDTLGSANVSIEFDDITLLISQIDYSNTTGKAITVSLYTLAGMLITQRTFQPNNPASGTVDISALNLHMTVGTGAHGQAVYIPPYRLNGSWG